MGKLRFLFALWMAKLSIPALKITHHNGTDFPGSLAVRLCPVFLCFVVLPKTIAPVYTYAVRIFQTRELSHKITGAMV